ncbi:hypothetical protein LZ30DRAFT_745880 [Colletotrichum cereale]|nr:hypothetical protein LZ30DRAFT_745880 [Colletotrichum cereale]
MVLQEIQYLRTWTPFRVDALGLVTILGAAEVDRAAGRLTRSWLTDYLPLLGAYTVSSNSVTSPIPGLTLYNVTDGIMATDVTGWFGRWLLCHDLMYSASTVRISILPERTRRHKPTRQIIGRLCSLAIGFLSLLSIIILTALIDDWWGFTNALSMFISVFVRRVVFSANIRAITAATGHQDPSRPEDEMEVKVFLTLPTGHSVTIFAPRSVVVNCLVTNPRPASRRMYDAARAVGWVAFGIHIIALGMASLLAQILSAGLMLAATVATVRRLGCSSWEECRVGESLLLERFDAPQDQDFRMAAYARLRLTTEEEGSMLLWSLMPHRSNNDWWVRYYKFIEENYAGALNEKMENKI